MENNVSTIKPEERKRLALKFFIASAVGLALFVVPINNDGDWTIAVSIISTFIKNLIKPYVPPVMTVVYAISAIGALWAKFCKPEIVTKNRLLKNLFVTSWGYIIIRCLAVVIAVMVLFQVGPEVIISESTGTNVLTKVIPNSITLLSLCAFALPLLLEFGLLQFVGIMLNNLFRKVFHLPGNAAVDCISSWLGGANMAVVLTDSQYVNGVYTRRESAIIMSCFSAGSISSALVLLSYGGIEDLFVPFYLLVTALGMVSAVVFSRIPPLSTYKDTYYNNNDQSIKNVIPEGYTKIQWAYECALMRAKQSYTLKSYFRDGFTTVFQVTLKVSPVLLTVGTFALILSEYTNVYYYLGLPFMPFFKLIGVSEATAAAGTLMAGFADNYIPSIIAGTTVQSAYAKFVIALASYNAIIYMTGNGSVMMQSETEVPFWHCFVIFLERTIFTIVVGGLLAKLLFL